MSTAQITVKNYKLSVNYDEKHEPAFRGAVGKINEFLNLNNLTG